MADLKQKFGTRAALSLVSNLTSLANGEGKALGEVDNTSLLSFDELIDLDITLPAASVSATGTIEVYILRAAITGTTTYTDGIDPDSTSNLLASLKTGPPIRVLPANANNQVVKARFSLREQLASMPPWWSLFIVNRCGAALHTSGHDCQHTPVIAQSV